MLQITLDKLMQDLGFARQGDVYLGVLDNDTYIVDTAEHPYRVYHGEDACMFTITNQLNECFNRLGGKREN